MFKHLNDYRVLRLTAILIILGVLLGTLGRAQDGSPMPRCQTPAPCKILILSPEEEAALTGERMILDSALNGRIIDMIGPVLYFRRKIEQAPRGLPLVDSPK